MYAVFKTGGKQYRATQGQKIKLEKLNANSGDKVLFTEVLSKDKKIEVIKFKRRKNYKRTFGHRQWYTLVEITGIKLKKETKSQPKKAAKPKKAAAKIKKAAAKPKKKPTANKKKTEAKD